MAGEAVAAAPDGEFEALLSRQRDDTRDVGGVLRPDDSRRTAIPTAVENGARRIIGIVFRRDDPPVEGGREARIRGRYPAMSSGVALSLIILLIFKPDPTLVATPVARILALT